MLYITILIFVSLTLIVLITWINSLLRTRRKYKRLLSRETSNQGIEDHHLGDVINYFVKGKTFTIPNTGNYLDDVRGKTFKFTGDRDGSRLYIRTLDYRVTKVIEISELYETLSGVTFITNDINNTNKGLVCKFIKNEEG